MKKSELKKLIKEELNSKNNFPKLTPNDHKYLQRFINDLELYLKEAKKSDANLYQIVEELYNVLNDEYGFILARINKHKK
jgi:hypothetical protein